MDDILRPASEGEVVEAVAGLVATRTPVEVIGHGGKRGLGNPVRAGVCLSLSALSGVRVFEPVELYVTVGAGTSLDEIEAVLAGEGQCLPFEPPRLNRLFAGGGDVPPDTAGGTVACNSSGPARVAGGGAPRDALLGFRAVSGRGEAFRYGGTVVKNVSGFDLCKLMAGSFGTLAVLTELTLKTVPLPESEVTVLFAGLDDRSAVALMTRIAGSPAGASGLAHLPSGALAGYGERPVTLVRLGGMAAGVDSRAGAVREFAGDSFLCTVEAGESRRLWTLVRDIGDLLPFPDAALWRLSVPPAWGADCMERLAARIRPLAWYHDLAGGLVHAAIPADCDVMSVHAALAEADDRPGFSGEALLLRRGAGMQPDGGAFPPRSPGVVRITERLKAQFDPAGLLNPARM